MSRPMREISDDVFEVVDRDGTVCYASTDAGTIAGDFEDKIGMPWAWCFKAGYRIRPKGGKQSDDASV